jgi:hypothetical protein
MNAAHAAPIHVNRKNRREPADAASAVLGFAGFGGAGLDGFSFASAGVAAGDSPFGVAADSPPAAFLAAAAARIFSSGLIGFDAPPDSPAGADFGSDAPASGEVCAPPAAAFAAAAARIFSSGLIGFGGSDEAPAPVFSSDSLMVRIPERLPTIPQNRLAKYMPCSVRAPDRRNHDELQPGVQEVE